MNVYEETSAKRDAMVENLAAELSGVVYQVALRHGTSAAWVDLELDLWKALTQAIKAWEETGRSDASAGAADRATRFRSKNHESHESHVSNQRILQSCDSCESFDSWFFGYCGDVLCPQTVCSRGSAARS